MIAENDRFKSCSHVAWREIAGQVVIVQPLEDKLLTLNPTGSFIWTLLESCDVGDIATRLAQQFDVNADEALQDTREFLVDMMERGLLEPAHE